MKSYTDIEQSKKLAEILPLESADHHYVRKVQDSMGKPVDGEWSTPKYGNPNSSQVNYIVMGFSKYETIPCWSLSALLGILTEQDFIIKNIENEFNIDIPIRHCKIWFSSLLDAAFEMVVWLLKNKKI